jgi:hypothetical protein
MNFDLLFNAQEGPELNPTFTDPDEYTDLQDIVSFISKRKKITDIRPLLPQMSLNGRVLEEDMSIYLDTKACSSGSLKEALKSPLHYLITTEEKQVRPDKTHFELGTFCHTAFLEPEKFDALALEPEGATAASKEGVQKLIEFWEDLADKKDELIKTEAYIQAIGSGLNVDKIDGMRCYLSHLKRMTGKVSVDRKSYQVVDLIKRNYYRYGDGIIPELLKGCVPEVSIYGTDEETELPVKIRPDAFQIEENIGCNAIISFKTTHADNLGKMQYDAAKYMYYMTEGMYAEVFQNVTGRKVGAVICIMLQTVLPYLPVVFIYDPEDLANGKYRYRTALRNVKEALAKDLWPGFDSFAESGDRGIVRMSLPEWSRREVLPQIIE